MKRVTWSVVLVYKGSANVTASGLNHRVAMLVWKQWKHSRENGIVVLVPDFILEDASDDDRREAS